jgi:hypothetical protein
MDVRRRWLAISTVVILIGWLSLALGSPAVEPQALPASPGASLSPSARPAPWVRMAQFPPGGQVTVTPGGVWLTYTEDGEGNLLMPSDFALDITTGDMWFIDDGRAVEISRGGEWTTHRVEDFGYDPPRALAQSQWTRRATPGWRCASPIFGATRRPMAA